ncbi:MAG: hypothetical protein ABI054_11430 [Planctomycetota bacterium]
MGIPVRRLGGSAGEFTSLTNVLYDQVLAHGGASVQGISQKDYGQLQELTMVRVSRLARCLFALAFANSDLQAQAQLEWLGTHDRITGAWSDYAGAAAVDAAGNVYLAIESRTPVT